MLRPDIKIKSIKCNSLSPDWYFSHKWAHFGIKPVAVHAEIVWRITESDEAGLEHCQLITLFCINV